MLKKYLEGGILLLLVVVMFTMFAPLGNEKKMIIIPEKVNGFTVAKILKEEGIIKNEMILRLALRAFNLSKDVKPGEFEIAKNISLFSLIHYISNSKNTHNYTIVIIEGFNKRQVRKLIESDSKLHGKLTEKIEEGYIMPDTYFYKRGATKNQIVRRAKGDMEKYLDNLWKNRSPDLPYKNKKEALIMASLVEKESAIKSERSIIAGVFLNRLKKGMRLQTDPTVAYGVGRDNAEGLTVRDLRNDNPYNTYRKKGLPIGPIANPSRESLKAAFYPQKNNYLFFVADGKGGHIFTSTLAEHNKEVVKWRAIEKRIKENN